MREEVVPFLKKNKIDEIFFYGTGCKNPANIKMIKKVLIKYLPDAFGRCRYMIFPARQKRFAEMKKALRVF